MNVVVAVDKFKGSLTSFEANSVIQSAIKKVNPTFQVTSFPMADGGDGFSKVLKFYLNTQTVKVNTIDPLHRKILGYYEWDKEHKTAIIEMAVASGLVLLKKKEQNPLKTSSYGTGLLIKHAINKGAKKIILGLGGTATNDGGMGIACALGYQFKDKSGNLLSPSGASLLQIHTIEKPTKRLPISIMIACDVNNPLFGKQGAAYIYAPQKGASLEQVLLLDKGLRNLSKVIEKSTHQKVAKIPGAGAAGGVPALLNAYFKTTMVNGIDLIMKYSGIVKQLKQVDLLITGEGKIDHQSMSGKVVGSLASLAAEKKVPILLVAGMSEIGPKSPFSKLEMITLLDSTKSLKYSILHAQSILADKIACYFK